MVQKIKEVDCRASKDYATMKGEGRYERLLQKMMKDSIKL
jgi:hypothetical protein